MSKDEIKLKWQQAPVKTQWGDEMVVASVAIDKDHTVCLYCERDQTSKVDAMFALAEQPAQQQAQIVRWNCPCGNKYTFHGFTEAPAQRAWVSLTDEDRAVIVEANTTDDHGYDIWCDGDGVARAIEAKLKEKNNA